MDRNGDGQFDRSEMYRALQQMGLLLTGNELTSVMDGFKLMAARAAQLAPASAPNTAMHARQALTHEDTLSEEVLRKLHVRFQAASYTAGGQDWPRLFGIVDRDHNGVLSQEELVRIVRKELKIPPTDIPDSTVGKFCRIFDSSGDGQLDVQELVTFLEHGPQSLSAKAGHTSETRGSALPGRRAGSSGTGTTSAWGSTLASSSDVTDQSQSRTLSPLKKTVTFDASQCMSWSVDQVVAWLDSIHLSQYAATFTQDAIDGSKLQGLTDVKLKTQLQISSLGHRKKLLHEIQALR
jgi:Ca2+-binding EF-hand superfamily protein